MYALAIVRYRFPLEEIDETYRDAHRECLRSPKKQEVLLASGPFQPPVDGALLLRVSATHPHEDLNKLRDEDPFTKHELAQYESRLWNVKTGIEDLDKITLPQL